MRRLHVAPDATTGRPVAYVVYPTTTGQRYAHLRNYGAVLDFIAEHPWAAELTDMWAKQDPRVEDPNQGVPTVAETLDITRRIAAQARRSQ